jgi:hypothetical protein
MTIFAPFAAAKLCPKFRPFAQSTHLGCAFSSPKPEHENFLGESAFSVKPKVTAEVIGPSIVPRGFNQGFIRLFFRLAKQSLGGSVCL